LLTGKCSPVAAVLPTPVMSLNAVVPESEGDDPALLLRAEHLDRAFQDYRARYDLILIDAPALIPVADAALLTSLADGVILSAMAGRTTKPQLMRARETCLGLGAKILGLVVGNLQEAVAGYGGYGYDTYNRKKPARGAGDGPQRST